MFSATLLPGVNARDPQGDGDQSRVQQVPGPGQDLFDVWSKVGPSRCCSPRHRMTLNSRNEGKGKRLMTWRAAIRCCPFTS